MSVVRRNVLANIAGKGWAALLSLALIPLYVRFLGIEAFGLIGFFLSLMAILSLFDLGLGTALNRQFAKLSAQPDSAQAMRDLLRTLEIVYWLIGITIGLAMVGLAPVISASWIKPQQLPTETVTQALALMGISVAVQWPRMLYTSGLMGLQRQVALNMLSSVTGTLNSAGGVLIVWLVSPTIQALIAWYIVIGLADTLLTGRLLWRSLPGARSRPAFNMQLLADLWRFAVGMTGISIMSVALTQLDKLILVNVLPLDAFGYYSLASRVAGGLYYLINPVSAAFFPRFSQLLAASDWQELARLYHRGCQLMAVVLVPVAAVFAFFSTDFLVLWTRDLAIAANTGTMLGVLVTGTAMNGLVNLPFTLQLADGWTRLVFLTHSVAVILLVPLIYFLSLHYGGVGAAWAWLVLNCGYVMFSPRIMHRRLLIGHLRQWIMMDLAAPLAAAMSVAILWRYFVGVPETFGWMLLNLVTVSALTLLAAAFAANQIRGLIMHYFPGKPQPNAGP
ncbi:MAG: oligosaccharide flippase family protein [Betaproteobacteria bacterium]|nr:oligosaccharide flippase family protein [Betaproteobacteria bacterium]